MLHFAIATATGLLGPGAQPERPPRASTEQVKGIVARIVTLAQENARAARPVDGDAMLDRLVRAAAAEADRLPADVRADAFLVAIAIGLDPGNTLATNPVTRRSAGGGFGGHETPVQFATRRAAVEKCGLKMRGRKDWVLHWSLSAGLSSRLGPDQSRAFGIAKEAMDLNGPSGWSWTDLNADLSGIEFAERLRAGKTTLKAIQSDFKAADALADPAGLEDTLAKAAFEKKYQAVGSPEMHKELDRIQARVKAHFDRVMNFPKR